MCRLPFFTILFYFFYFYLSMFFVMFVSSFKLTANGLALGEEADFEALNCLPPLPIAIGIDTKHKASFNHRTRFFAKHLLYAVFLILTISLLFCRLHVFRLNRLRVLFHDILFLYVRQQRKLCYLLHSIVYQSLLMLSHLSGKNKLRKN